MRMIIGGLKNRQKAVFSLCVLCAVAFICVAVSVAFRKEAPKSAAGADYIYSILGEATEEQTADGGMNVLLLGRDFDSNRTDAVVCVSFDFEEGSVKTLQLPRDSYVKDGDFSGRLANLLPRYKTEAEGDGDSLTTGIERLMQKLSADLGLPIHRYVFVESSIVATVTDALGGVTVNIPADIDYTDASRAIDLHLSEGKQTLDGKTAEMFVRYRQGYPQADMGRLDAQKLYVAAVFEKLSSFAAAENAIALADALAQCIKTNLTAEEVARLAAFLFGVDADSVIMFSAPGNGVSVSGAMYYGIYKEKLEKVLSGFYGFGGTVAVVGFPEEAGGYTDTEGERLSSVLEHGIAIPVYVEPTE